MGGHADVRYAAVFVDLADVVFAVDSIPAIFAVTQDPFIVSPRMLRHLGLRSLYFAVAGLMAMSATSS